MEEFVITITHNGHEVGTTRKISHNLRLSYVYHNSIIMGELDKGIEFVRTAVESRIKLLQTYTKLEIK